MNRRNVKRVLLFILLSSLFLYAQDNNKEDNGILEGKRLVKFSEECECYLYSTNKGVTWLRYDKKNEKPALKIYPNPGRNVITVEIQDEDFEKIQLNFFKNNYDLYYTLTETDPGGNKVSFNISDIKPDFYLIDVLVDGDNYGTFTFMKK